MVVAAGGGEGEAEVAAGKALEREGFLKFGGGRLEIGSATPERNVDSKKNTPLIAVSGDAVVMLKAGLDKGKPWDVTCPDLTYAGPGSIAFTFERKELGSA